MDDADLVRAAWPEGPSGETDFDVGPLIEAAVRGGRRARRRRVTAVVTVTLTLVSGAAIAAATVWPGDRSRPPSLAANSAELRQRLVAGAKTDLPGWKVLDADHAHLPANGVVSSAITFEDASGAVISAVVLQVNSGRGGQRLRCQDLLRAGALVCRTRNAGGLPALSYVPRSPNTTVRSVLYSLEPGGYVELTLRSGQQAPDGTFVNRDDGRVTESLALQLLATIIGGAN